QLPPPGLVRSADNDVTDAVGPRKVNHRGRGVLRLDADDFGPQLTGVFDVLEQPTLRLGIDEVGRFARRLHADDKPVRVQSSPHARALGEENRGVRRIGRHAHHYAARRADGASGALCGARFYLTQALQTLGDFAERELTQGGEVLVLEE